MMSTESEDKALQEALAKRDEVVERIDSLLLIKIRTYLLEGRVVDAEEVAMKMNDRTRADLAIADWKKRYKNMPHGQWDGMT